MPVQTAGLDLSQFGHLDEQRLHFDLSFCEPLHMDDGLRLMLKNEFDGSFEFPWFHSRLSFQGKGQRQYILGSVLL